MPASWEGDVGLVVSLLVHGAEVERPDVRTGWTALHVAARRGQEEVFAALVAAGADLHRIDRLGRSVLAYAVLGGHPALVRFLLEHSVDPNGGALALAAGDAPLLVCPLFSLLSQSSERWTPPYFI